VYKQYYPGMVDHLLHKQPGELEEACTALEQAAMAVDELFAIIRKSRIDEPFESYN